MLDFHTHIIYDVDDGAQNLDESIEMVKFLREKGFEGAVATPHANSLYYPNREILNEKRKKILENIEFKIIIGYEVRVDAIEIFQIDKFLIEETNYILLEFDFIKKPSNLFEPFMKVIKQGFRPILAHPERYFYLSIDEIKMIKDLGVIIQVNLKSLLGIYGETIKKKALEIWEFCDLLGSDAHSIKDYRDMEHFEFYKDKNFSKFLLGKYD